jgi:hypothetical protein
MDQKPPTHIPSRADQHDRIGGREGDDQVGDDQQHRKGEQNVSPVDFLGQRGQKDAGNDREHAHGGHGLSGHALGDAEILGDGGEQAHRDEFRRDEAGYAHEQGKYRGPARGSGAEWYGLRRRVHDVLLIS